MREVYSGGRFLGRGDATTDVNGPRSKWSCTAKGDGPLGLSHHKKELRKHV